MENLKNNNKNNSEFTSIGVNNHSTNSCNNEIDENQLDVICQHKRDGNIVPIKIRMIDSDGEFQQYMIKGYKDISAAKDITMPNGITIVSKENMRLFECKIEVFRQERLIHILYNQKNSSWRIVK